MSDESKQDSDYLVVFEYTAAAGGYKGVRTYSPYSSKAEFDAHFAKYGKLESGEKIIGEERVVAEGVTEEEALRAVRCTSLKSYVSAAIQEATGPDGTLNREAAEMRLRNVILARGGIENFFSRPIR